MKKITKLIVVALASIFVSTAAFADDFDWSQCWCTYGGGLSEGNVIVDIGAGFDWSFFSFSSEYRNWFIPAVEATVEVPVMIWKLPFSFGGSVYYSAHGYSTDSYRYHNHNIATAGMVKYHVHLPPENLDVYAGFKLGVGASFAGYTGNKTESGNNWYFHHSELLGASWYFSKSFGVNAEFGYPIAFKAGISLKF